MMQQSHKHILYYIAFTLVQVLCLTLVIMGSGSRELQMIAIIASAVFYFVFAMAHHILEHDLTGKIVVEYALIGCLGLAVSLALFNIYL